MNALIILILSGTACCLMTLQRPAWAVQAQHHGVRAAAQRHRSGQPTESLPRLVRQLASLLAAGRTGPILWDALALVLAVEQDRAHEHARSPTIESPGSGRRHLAPLDSDGVALDATLQLILAVQRAAAMGLPTAAAVRNACRTLGSDASGVLGRRTHQGGLTAEQRRMWLDIAACFDVCEASGAPVAAVLERLATTLEADHDAAALRETALAGPRATVKLLTWLPVLGLGLGMLMGVDPVSALLGSSLGWLVLAAGIGFAVAGRAWSGSMIANAARPAKWGDKRSLASHQPWWRPVLPGKD